MERVIAREIENEWAGGKTYNTSKMQIVHFRKTNHIFKCGKNLDVVDKYK